VKVERGQQCSRVKYIRTKKKSENSLKLIYVRCGTLHSRKVSEQTTTARNMQAVRDSASNRWLWLWLGCDLASKGLNMLECRLNYCTHYLEHECSRHR
jgi:hypothetical protein